LNGGAKVLMSGLDYERAVLAAGADRHHAVGVDQVIPYTTTASSSVRSIANSS